MKKFIICFVILLSMNVILHAQYMGGNGNGDVSVSLMNVHLPINEITVNLPVKYELKQNYPNPFNPTTNIIYEIPKSSFVRLNIYDALGRKIETLVNEKQPAGTYVVPLNAGEYSSGVYFYAITAGDFLSVKKMLLIK